MSAVALHKKTRSPEVRAEALRLAAEHGAAHASRLTGIPAATIRSWRLRGGESAPPSGVDPSAWAQRKQAGAEEAWEAAQEALGRVRELLKAGDERKARDSALTFAILTDKSGVLSAAAAVAEERQRRITEEHARVIAETILGTLDALGVQAGPYGSPLRKLLRIVGQQATTGGRVSIPAGVAEAARAQVCAGLEVAE